jgi:hypothetical protein
VPLGQNTKLSVVEKIGRHRTLGRGLDYPVEILAEE